MFKVFLMLYKYVIPVCFIYSYKEFVYNEDARDFQISSLQTDLVKRGFIKKVL
jgi:hypothetical protein